MKNKIKRLIAIILSAFTIFAFASCFEEAEIDISNDESDSSSEEMIPLDVNHGIADQSKLFGMCYLKEERINDENYDMKTEVQLMKNLGVKTVRQWMHFSYLLLNKNSINTYECNKMHELLELSTAAGLINIGMNHHNFNSGTNSVGKPKRLLMENGTYVNWLNDYYTSWYTLVSEFPEVQYWEIDNEVNNSDFMKDIYGNNVYSLQEMADIATDMFYYASRAIHDANPNAKTIMGSLTEPQGLGKGNSVVFLETLYSNIESGDYGYLYYKEQKENASCEYDDYFEIACWHPYMWDMFDENYFVEKNNDLYNIILNHEGKHKKVFLTEIGFNDIGKGEENTAIALEKMYKVVKDRMPYVETVNYFKMFDDGTTSAWGGGGDYIRYGLFYDPDVTRKYPLLNKYFQTPSTGGTIAINGDAKNKAYIYQKLAGGEGSLKLLVKE